MSHNKANWDIGLWDIAKWDDPFISSSQQSSSTRQFISPRRVYIRRNREVLMLLLNYLEMKLAKRRAK